MTKNVRQNVIVLIVCICLVMGFLLDKTETSWGEPTQPTVTLTPYAFLPIILKPAPFVKTELSPFYLQNYANNAGCNWMGIAGEVFDLDQNPVPAGGYNVHIWGSGIDTRKVVGSAPAYGPSAWEQFLFDSPAVRDYELQLESASGTAVSPVYAVQTRASCNENLVRFDFIQNQ